MRIPLILVDRGRLLSGHLSRHIDERTQKLARFFRGVRGCRVTVDGPQRHPARGRIWIRVEITVPGSRILINRQTGEDLSMAIRESFDAADERLEDYVRNRRHAWRTRRHRQSRTA